MAIITPAPHTKRLNGKLHRGDNLYFRTNRVTNKVSLVYVLHPYHGPATERQKAMATEDVRAHGGRRWTLTNCHTICASELTSVHKI